MAWRIRTRCGETGELLEDIVKPFETEEEARWFQRFTIRFVRNAARAANREWEERPYGADPRDIAMRIVGRCGWAAVTVEEETDGDTSEGAAAAAPATNDSGGGGAGAPAAAAVDAI